MQWIPGHPDPLGDPLIGQIQEPTTVVPQLPLKHDSVPVLALRTGVLIYPNQISHPTVRKPRRNVRDSRYPRERIGVEL